MHRPAEQGGKLQHECFAPGLSWKGLQWNKYFTREGIWIRADQFLFCLGRDDPGIVIKALARDPGMAQELVAGKTVTRLRMACWAISVFLLRVRTTISTVTGASLTCTRRNR